MIWATSIFTIIKEVIVCLKYYLQIKSRNLELDQIYDSQDREEDIHKNIILTVKRKNEIDSEKEGYEHAEARRDYYDSVRELQLRKLRQQQIVSRRLRKGFNSHSR